MNREEDIIKHIELMNPKPEDVILLKADIDDIGTDKLNNIIQTVAKRFSQPVIALPSVISIKILSVNYLEKWIEMATKVMNEIKGRKYGNNC